MSNETIEARLARLEAENARLRQKEGPSDDEWMDGLVAESEGGTKTSGGLPSAVAQIPNLQDQEVQREQQDCARVLQGYNFPLTAFDQTPDENGNSMLSNDAINAGIAVGAQLGINPDRAIARLQQASQLTTEQLNENLGGKPLVILPPKEGLGTHDVRSERRLPRTDADSE